MARSVKKGPYVGYKLMRKVDRMTGSNKKSVIKTWSRSCQPEILKDIAVTVNN